MRWERRKRRKVLLRPYSSFPPSLLIFLQIRLWEIRVVKKFGKKGETELLFFPFSKEMEREKTTFLRGPQKGKYKKARKWRHSFVGRGGRFISFLFFFALPPLLGKGTTVVTLSGNDTTKKEKEEEDQLWQNNVERIDRKVCFGESLTFHVLHFSRSLLSLMCPSSKRNAKKPRQCCRWETESCFPPLKQASDRICHI